jgi:hypothetical protein
MLFTFTTQDPIFILYGQGSKTVTLDAPHIHHISHQRLLPIVDYTFLSEGNHSSHGAIVNIVQFDSASLLYKASVVVNGRYVPVIITTQAIYENAYTHHDSKYPLHSILDPEQRAIQNVRTKMDEAIRQTLVAGLHKQTIPFFKQLDSLPFKLTLSGHHLLSLLYGTPPSHYDKGDAFKYLGELMGRSLKNLVDSWDEQIQQASTLPKKTQGNLRQQYDLHPPRKQVKHTFNFPCLIHTSESLLAHSADFVPHTHCLQLHNAIMDHLLSLAQDVLPNYLSQWECDPVKHHWASLWLEQYKNKIKELTHEITPSSFTPSYNIEHALQNMPEYALGKNLS